MPRFFYNSNNSSPEDAVRNEVEINAIVAYLFANADTHEFAVKNPPHGDAKSGEQIVQSIGCQGCHVVGEGSREAAGPRRTFIGLKTEPGSIPRHGAAVIGRGHVLHRCGQPARRPEIRDAAPAHDQRDVAAARLLLGDDAHRRDARPAGHKQQVARLAAGDERGPERTEQVERVADATAGDPFAAAAERLDDELDLTGASIDAAERVWPS